MIDTAFSSLREGLGVKAARRKKPSAATSRASCFEEDLYDVVAEMGRQFGDETELVRGTPGIHKCKTGDHLITLGETTGRPACASSSRSRIRRTRRRRPLPNCRKRRRTAKPSAASSSSRRAASRWSSATSSASTTITTARWTRRSLAEGGPLPFLWAAYELARVQAVAAVRKEAGGKLDLEAIQQHIDGIAAWVPRWARSSPRPVRFRRAASPLRPRRRQIKEDIEHRIQEVMAMLQHDAA